MMGNKTGKHTLRLEQSAEFDSLENTLQDQCAPPICLPMDFLKAITHGFSEKQELGRGGFGVVYKGVLQNGKAIAVKKLSEIHLEDDQFHKEVTYLFGLKHQNIVQLVGYCAESRWEAAQVSEKYVMAEVRKRLLCFEYINNKSLDKHISAESYGLEWHIRYEIIKGICRGLHYLHTECHIVHLDLKPENILLDDSMVPKIADFGMSRLFGQQQSRIVTESRAGTLGYMAPEYLTNGLISTKSDIFSLGVIIIELMTGSRDYPFGTEEAHEHFTENVAGNWRNRLEESATCIPLEKYVQQVKTCIFLGLTCVAPDPNKRPATSDIIESLIQADGTNTNGGPPELQASKSLIDGQDSAFQSLPTFVRLERHDPLRGTPSSSPLYPSLGEVEFTGDVGDKLVHFDGLMAFTPDDLLCATVEITGNSSYGTLYKATLEDGSQVTVKRLGEKITKQGHKVFKAEAAVLGKIRHPNLLALRAYYLGPKEEKLIVFDYMPMGSLSDFLHARVPNSLDWATRMAIAMGTTRGLTYLHEDLNIVHGNVTASNILLDYHSSPKIAYFGLSRLMTAAAHSNVLAAAGALGYRAPELSNLNKASAKTDVYSLGVIILELLTGKSPADSTNGMGLPKWVSFIIKEEWTCEVFDPELMRDEPTVEEELMETLALALRCVNRSPSVRPKAREVLEQLEHIQRGPADSASRSEDSSPLAQSKDRVLQ